MRLRQINGPTPRVRRSLWRAGGGPGPFLIYMGLAARRRAPVTGRQDHHGRDFDANRVYAPHTLISMRPSKATQFWSVVRAGSAGSSVAAQLPRSLSASSDREPGSTA